MSKNSRTLWSEGMFLGPHHFQQHDRFLLSTIAGVNAGSSPYPFGMTSIEFDKAALAEGRISLLVCSGIFADGTVFICPADASLPEPLNITLDDVGKIVSIGIPFESHSDKDVAMDADHQSFARYLAHDQSIIDRQTPDSNSEETIFTSSLWLRLLFEGADETAFHTIPVAKVQDLREDGTILLESAYFPCAMALGASENLFRHCRDIEALLTQRGTDLSSRVGRPDSADSSQLTQFFLLQIINRAKPLFKHMLHTDGLHPEIVFRELVKIAGELSTFCSTSRLAPELPAYNHRDQYGSFHPVISNIRESLNFTIEQNVNQFTVEHVTRGIFTCTVTDNNLFHEARFLLAASARMQKDALMNQFAQQTTIASQDKLKDLVTTATPGVPLVPLRQVPNNIPMYDDFAYFEIERGSSLWTEIAVTGMIAMHISGNFPDLQLQLWTINH